MTKKPLTTREARNVAKTFADKTDEQLEGLVHGVATSYGWLAAQELKRRRAVADRRVADIKSGKITEGPALLAALLPRVR